MDTQNVVASYLNCIYLRTTKIMNYENFGVVKSVNRDTGTSQSEE